MEGSLVPGIVPMSNRCCCCPSKISCCVISIRMLEVLCSSDPLVMRICKIRNRRTSNSLHASSSLIVRSPKTPRSLTCRTTRFQCGLSRRRSSWVTISDTVLYWGMLVSVTRPQFLALRDTHFSNCPSASLRPWDTLGVVGTLCAKLNNTVYAL